MSTGTDARRAHLAAASEQLAEQIKALTEQRDAVTAELRDLGPGPAGVRPDGTPRVVEVEAVAKFSATQAKAVLSPDQYAAICATVPVAAVAKRLLAPAVYDACRVVPAGTKPTVNIR